MRNERAGYGQGLDGTQSPRPGSTFQAMRAKARAGRLGAPSEPPSGGVDRADSSNITGCRDCGQVQGDRVSKILTPEPYEQGSRAERGQPY